uniref:Uncharacterized protein n=1 Tax=Anguilla anguilla TaxID=7936 RepID=A0A0E9XTV6_ANGAN
MLARHTTMFLTAVYAKSFRIVSFKKGTLESVSSSQYISNWTPREITFSKKRNGETLVIKENGIPVCPSYCAVFQMPLKNTITKENHRAMIYCATIQKERFGTEGRSQKVLITSANFHLKTYW